jgi:protein-tyrosine phosphatase
MTFSPPPNPDLTPRAGRPDQGLAGLIALHCHLLPGVDDGCQSLPESLDCAREMVKAGFTHSFCTPHITPIMPRNRIANISVWTQRLQRELDAAGIPLRLIPGGEINLRPDLVDITTPEELVTYAFERKYLLCDVWADVLPGFFDSAIRWFQRQGLTVLLAHPERVRAVQRDPDLVDHFRELGVLLQGNLQCLGDPPGSDTNRIAERLLMDGRYFALSSDLHNLATLPVRLAGIGRAIELVGRQTVLTLLRDNPRKLLPAEA